MGVVFGKVSVETPDHKVVHQAAHYQIWRYPQLVAATVHAKDLQLKDGATEDEANSAAFRALARYIGVFNKAENRARSGVESETIAMTAPVEMTPEPIAMTAPVEMSPARDPKEMKMSFFLPAKYKSVDQAPIPTNVAVKLVPVPSRYVAVVQFSGNMHLSSSEEKAKALLESLKDDGVTVTGAWSYCGYNPPFTLPWMKRNEIHVPVDGSQFDTATES